MKSETIMVTGANGQIGTVLTRALREVWGDDKVIATDIRPSEGAEGRFSLLNVLDRKAVGELVIK